MSPAVDVAMTDAIKALQRMFLAFTGRELPEAEARKLIEEIMNEPEDK